MNNVPGAASGADNSMRMRALTTLHAPAVDDVIMRASADDRFDDSEGHPVEQTEVCVLPG